MQQRPWPEQAFLFAAFFFGYYGFVGVFSPYMTLYFSDMGITAVQIGALMSVAQAMRMVGPLVWGWLADRTQKRVSILRLTSLLAAMSSLGWLFGQGFVYYLFVMVILSFFAGAQGPLLESLMLSEMRGDLSHYGSLRLWGSVGYIAVVLGAGGLLDWLGAGLVPWICAALLGMVLIVNCRLKEVVSTAKVQVQVSLGSVLKKREVIAYFTSSALKIASHMGLYAFYSLYLAKLGYSGFMIGLMWSLGVVAEILFFYYQTPIFKRFGLEKLWLFSFLVSVGRFVLIGAGGESLLILLFAQTLHGITFGTHHASNVMMLQRWFSGPLQSRGQALLVSVSYGFGGCIGGLFLSQIWRYLNAESVFYFSSGIALLGWMAACLSVRWQRQAKATNPSS